MATWKRKVHVIESVDEALPQLMALKPDVLAITGDHSTPCKMKSHSWHPVPLLLWAPETIRPDDQDQFGEKWCAKGNLGTFPGTDLLQLLLGHADKLMKYGAKPGTLPGNIYMFPALRRIHCRSASALIQHTSSPVIMNGFR